MYVAGLWGGLNLNGWTGHDASAVLLADDACVAAIEEERLSRVKHTRRAPRAALAFCLEQAGIALADVDRLAIGVSEKTVTDRSRTAAIDHAIGAPVPRERIAFVEHHVAHAYGAYAASGYEQALVVTLDGQGEEHAGLVGRVRGTEIQRLRDITIPNSLGLFYLLVTNFLGYRLFDEYKVMGLAPYGDPSRFRAVLQELYTLEPDGHYRLALERPEVLWRIGPRRRRDEPFTQTHKDLAASLQEVLETIVLHVLRHFRRVTRLRSLCLSGGVAHNCSMNGAIAASGLFDRLFVHPAAHDAGTALGAATLVARRQGPRRRGPRPLRDVSWGSPTPRGDDLLSELRRWDGYIRVRRAADVSREAAALLAQGAVIGWVQGRSEFGPRALGNRSILADPRPAAHRERINAMIKKREAFRPFAPSVLAERAHEYFEIPPAACNLAHMVFVVPVRAEKRALLGAVTHVDGTARIQTVSADVNEPYWRLIHAFGEETGVFVLLNTSFNNAWEPIVDSVEDALVCFLTTGLHYLVIGDCIIERQELTPARLAQLIVTTAPHVDLSGTPSEYAYRCEDPTHIRPDGETRRTHALSRHAYDALTRADGVRTLGELTAAVTSADRGAVVDELLALWERRHVRLRPFINVACPPPREPATTA